MPSLKVYNSCANSSSGSSNKRTSAVQQNAQNDDSVMNLVELALAKPPAERESWLRTACSGDSQLFREVWKYVNAEQRMNGFLLDTLCSPASTEHPFERGEVLDGRF